MQDKCKWSKRYIFKQVSTQSAQPSQVFILLINRPNWLHLSVFLIDLYDSLSRSAWFLCFDVTSQIDRARTKRNNAWITSGVVLCRMDNYLKVVNDGIKNIQKLLGSFCICKKLTQSHKKLKLQFYDEVLDLILKPFYFLMNFCISL